MDTQQAVEAFFEKGRDPSEKDIWEVGQAVKKEVEKAQTELGIIPKRRFFEMSDEIDGIFRRNDGRKRRSPGPTWPSRRSAR